MSRVSDEGHASPDAVLSASGIGNAPEDVKF
jgi:hypothetical protein